MSDIVDATGYLVITGTRTRYSVDGKHPVRNAKISRATQGKPARLVGDEVAVKVTVRLPAAAFDPLQPEALVVVPEELIQHPVVVEATV